MEWITTHAAWAGDCVSQMGDECHWSVLHGKGGDAVQGGAVDTGGADGLMMELARQLSIQ